MVRYFYIYDCTSRTMIYGDYSSRDMVVNDYISRLFPLHNAAKEMARFNWQTAYEL